MYQKSIYHGHFIHNNNIALQRILFISSKLSLKFFSTIAFRRTTYFKNSVNSFCFMVRSLIHSLGSSSCRSCKTHIHAVSFKHCNDGVYSCSLSCSRTSRDNGYTIILGFNYCLSLKFIQLYSSHLFNSVKFYSHNIIIFRSGNIQFQKHAGNI